MIRQKISNIKTSIFAVMTKLADEHNAINLSQGFPNFQMPEELIYLVSEKMKQGFNQYAPMPGVLALRQQLSEKVNKLYSKEYDPETEITITAGGTQALHTAITSLISEGDEVIIFEPAYDSYAPVVRLNGGRPVYVKLEYPDYNIDWGKVNQLINGRTRLIIINTPHNPSGKVFTEEDMANLERLVSGTKIIILSDEVYEHITFDENKHFSIAKYPKLAERSILVFSFGKVFHATGWKMGYAMAPEKLMNEFRKVHQFTVFAVNTPMQHAIAEFLKVEEYYLSLPNFFQQKRDTFCGLLKDIGFEFTPVQGTYFQPIDFSKFTDEGDYELAVELIKKYKIASIPMSEFYHNPVKSKVLRFCFAKDEETLKHATEKLSNFYNDFS